MKFSVSEYDAAALLERLLQRIERVPFSTCWYWVGRINGSGYGLWRPTARHKPQRVHRMVYVLLVGPLSDEQHLCHRCDTPACVNPAHLFPGTDADNVADAMAKKRHAHHESHGRRKLSASDVAQIRAHVGPLAELSAKFGVHLNHIGRIRARKLWR